MILKAMRKRKNLREVEKEKGNVKESKKERLGRSEESREYENIVGGKVIKKLKQNMV